MSRVTTVEYEVPESPGAVTPSGGRLGLLDASSIIVGIIIGVGFIESSPLVARSAGSFAATLLVWAIGGVTALLGAACYAELATMFPLDGGEYVYLTHAFGPRLGFLFAWTATLVVRPGNIGAMALVFGKYASELLPLGNLSPGRSTFGWACLAILTLTGVNALGLRGAKWTQNLLSAAKVLGLLALFAVAFLAPVQADAATAATPGTQVAATSGVPNTVNFGLAMVMVLFAYGGWEDVTYVSAEIRNPARNLRLALVLGTLAVMAIYLVGSIAFMHSLGWSGLARADVVASEILQRPLGNWAARAVSLLVAVCALGALNGMTLTGSRIAYAAAKDHPAIAVLGSWDGKRGVPVRALFLQTSIVLGLLCAVGGDSGSFERIVVLTVPIFWSFYILVGTSIFIFRSRDPNRLRPYRVPLYPLTPALFCLTGAYMLHAGATYAWENRTIEAFWGLGVLLVGLVLLPWTKGRSQRPA